MVNRIQSLGMKALGRPKGRVGKAPELAINPIDLRSSLPRMVCEGLMRIGPTTFPPIGALGV